LIYTYVVDYPLLVVSRHVVDTRYSIILQLQFVRATYYQIANVLPNCESVKEKSQLTLKMCICASLKS
jgi:hypothetical protein